MSNPKNLRKIKIGVFRVAVKDLNPEFGAYHACERLKDLGVISGFSTTWSDDGIVFDVYLETIVTWDPRSSQYEFFHGRMDDPISDLSDWASTLENELAAEEVVDS